MWMEHEDVDQPGSDVIRIVIAESGHWIDIVLEDGLRPSRGTPRVMLVDHESKNLRISIGIGREKHVESDNDPSEDSMPPGLTIGIDKSRRTLLSHRESEVLSHLSVGEGNKEIARKMSISDETVRGHVKSIFRKTGMENRTQAALWAVSGKDSQDLEC